MLDYSAQQRLKERFYPQARADALGALWQALDRHLPPCTLLFDAGCGHGTWVLERHRSRIPQWVGLDAAPPTRSHLLDDFLLGDLGHVPLEDGSCDIVFCWDVIEHVPQPAAAFAEFYRVLRDEGVLIVKTPCLTSPVMLVSRLSPTFVHRGWKARLLHYEKNEVFPTFYRCNTVAGLHRQLAAAGFRREVLTRFDDSYNYLAFSRRAYILGLYYSRALKMLPWGQHLMAQIFAVYRKTAPTPTIAGIEEGMSSIKGSRKRGQPQ
jgi:SAM-dependent methyltransferase